ncbi:unnamed protein product [Urochloa decumbens]|uniref:BTB domain-containing protein n=2 Tax=Urochloa decumbens TaxID=240449 RepID=A0ABC8WBG8_9POAL
MNHTITQTGVVVTSVLQIKIEGFSIAKANMKDYTDSFKSTCNIDGYDWEIRFLGDRDHPGLELVFLGESRTNLMAVLSVKVVTGDPRRYDESLPLKENKTMPKAFHRRLDRSLPIYIVPRDKEDGYFETCSTLTLECSVTVFREPAQAEGAMPVPSSNLTQHLGELLRSQAVGDVVFSVIGESFAAHKSVLAARSPVFMAEFFTERKEENSSQRVEVQDMDVTVFKAMLGFIYTDAVPELDEKSEAAATMAFAEKMLVAAVRYGLDRLKVMCERKLALAMDASTVASMLSLAAQQNCSWLKAQCVEFITGGSQENLDTVSATEGYRHLAASNPLMMTELLKAAHGKKCTCSCKTLPDISHQDKLRILRSTQAAPLPTVKHTFTQLSEGVQSLYLLKIDGFSVTKATIGNKTNCIKSRCNVDGYDLEIRFYPAYHDLRDSYYSAVQLAFLGKACTQGVEARLSGRLVQYQGSGVSPIECKPESKVFRQPSDCTSAIYIGKGRSRNSQPPASLTVECTITMFRDLKSIRLPTSDLHQQLDELFNSQIGADVMFTVSGESFLAHKNILAARSPVFKAEFYGEMEENTSCHVEIKDMEAQVFQAMLHFIYTDMVPREFDNQSETVDGTVMAEHLLVAADRYGLDRLKVMSEHRLSLSIGTETVASTLTLAEQFNCSHLKARCIEFISGGSSKQLDAVLETEGYRNLEVSSPSVLTEIIKATHRNKRSRTTDS